MFKKYFKELQKNSSIVFKIKVNTDARKTECVEEKNSKIYLNIKAKAEKGKANQELIRYLSKIFQINEKNVKIIQGTKSKNKLVKITTKYAKTK